LRKKREKGDASFSFRKSPGAQADVRRGPKIWKFSRREKRKKRKGTNPCNLAGRCLGSGEMTVPKEEACLCQGRRRRSREGLRFDVLKDDPHLLYFRKERSSVIPTSRRRPGKGKGEKGRSRLLRKWLEEEGGGKRGEPAQGPKTLAVGGKEKKMTARASTPIRIASTRGKRESACAPDHEEKRQDIWLSVGSGGRKAVDRKKGETRLRSLRRSLHRGNERRGWGIRTNFQSAQTSKRFQEREGEKRGKVTVAFYGDHCPGPGKEKKESPSPRAFPAVEFREGEGKEKTRLADQATALQAGVEGKRPTIRRPPWSALTCKVKKRGAISKCALYEVTRPRKKGELGLRCIIQIVETGPTRGKEEERKEKAPASSPTDRTVPSRGGKKRGRQSLRSGHRHNPLRPQRRGARNFL